MRHSGARCLLVARLHRAGQGRLRGEDVRVRGER
jgi:hypothetical protein